jgi:hypothetical protein
MSQECAGRNASTMRNGRDRGCRLWQMTRADLLQLAATGSDEELLNQIWEFIPESEKDPESWYEAGDILAVVDYANAEICNGGFFQFYANNIFDPLELVTQFELLNARELAECVRLANERFPEASPPARGYSLMPIEDELERLGLSPESFEDLEDRYYAAAESLPSIYAQHIRRNVHLYALYLPA